MRCYIYRRMNFISCVFFAPNSSCVRIQLLCPTHCPPLLTRVVPIIQCVRVFVAHGPPFVFCPCGMRYNYYMTFLVHCVISNLSIFLIDNRKFTNKITVIFGYNIYINIIITCTQTTEIQYRLFIS